MKPIWTLETWSELTISELKKVTKSLQPLREGLFKKNSQISVKKKNQCALWHFNLLYPHFPLLSSSVDLKINNLVLWWKPSGLATCQRSIKVLNSFNASFWENCHLFELYGDSLEDSAVLGVFIDLTQGWFSANSLSPGAVVDNKNRQLFNIATAWVGKQLRQTLSSIESLKEKFRN